MTTLDLFLLALVAAGLTVLLSRRVLNLQLWRATATPLASIIGSGFLVLGPVLAVEFGRWAPLAMAALCLVAWGFGGAIRYSIAALGDEAPGARDRMETLAAAALAFAYVISVAYYLNLLGSFALSLTSFGGGVWDRALTSLVFIGILAIGWYRGFNALERLELFAVGLKLAVIAGLIAGLAWYFGGAAADGALISPAPQTGGWAALTLGFGLIVTVQGFETSRYLGEEHDAATRVRSMRLAQIIATAIYLVYTILLTYALEAPLKGALTEIAVIGMMGEVALILPLLLVVAALAAQLSAAVADANGAGGLVRELSGGRLPMRAGYLALTAAGLALTWGADVFEIISYASRAFAAYYAVEAAIATRLAFGRRDRARGALFAGLAALGVAIALFGRAVEGA